MPLYGHVYLSSIGKLDVICMNSESRHVIVTRIRLLHYSIGMEGQILPYQPFFSITVFFQYFMESHTHKTKGTFLGAKRAICAFKSLSDQLD